MIYTGYKASTLSARDIPAFEEHIEFGLCVPMDDYKFLRAYELLSVKQDYTSVATEIDIDEDFDLDTVFPTNWVYNIDGSLVKNTVIGPSTGTNSEGLTQIRHGYGEAGVGGDTIYINDAGDTLRMNLNENDNIVIAQYLPVGWDALNTNAGTGQSSIRTPNMAGITGHTNSFIVNISGTHDIELPMTAMGSIDYRYSYRFSFYYRSYGSVLIEPKIYFYDNAGVLISIASYGAMIIDNTATSEDSDFHFFQIGIPRLGLGESIPSNTKRIKIILSLTTGSTGRIEIIYPTLEHVMGLSSVSGYIFMPEAPSSFQYSINYSEEKKSNPDGSISSVDTSKLCLGHIGRKLFDVTASFGLVEIGYLEQLRKIEEMCLMGCKVCLRSKHPDLPLVMKGTINLTNNNPIYDYQYNNLEINFSETE